MVRAFGRGDIAVANYRNDLHRLDHGADTGQVYRSAKTLLSRPAMDKNRRHADVLERARQVRRRNVLRRPIPGASWR